MGQPRLLHLPCLTETLRLPHDQGNVKTEGCGTDSKAGTILQSGPAWSLLRFNFQVQSQEFLMKPQTVAGIIPELRRRQGERSKASDFKTGPGGIGIEIARKATTDFTDLSWNCP